jgi:ABC-2 type transport system permease protein
MRAILKKELSDHFSSFRFLIIFALITMLSLILVYMSAMAISEDLKGDKIPQFVFLMLFTSSRIGFSLVQFVAFFGPLIGLILGFDTINRERNEGTLSKILSQPIYRDDVVNGKFLAGVVTITIMLVSIILFISGLGIRWIGVVPGVEEVLRIIVYIIVSIFYISFWLGVSILFSIVFRSIATSAIASFAIWIFFSFFVTIGANMIAGIIAPIDRISGSDIAIIIRHNRIKEMVSLCSPLELYNDATAAIIDPLKKTTTSLVIMGHKETLSSSRFQGALPIGQSILLVFPYISLLIAITLIFFAISYIVFMRQEIRSV